MTRWSIVIGLALATLACGVKLTKYDIQTGQSELNIAEDAAVSRICLQWLADASQTTYEWKCVDISELRKILFPKAGVW